MRKRGNSSRVPDRRHQPSLALPSAKFPPARECPHKSRSSNTGPERRLADSGDGENLRVGGRIEGLRCAVVTGGGHHQRARLYRAGDGTLQGRVVGGAAQTEIDDLRAGARLDRSTRAIVGGETGGVQHALSYVVTRAEPTDPQHPHGSDAHMPIHPVTPMPVFPTAPIVPATCSPWLPNSAATKQVPVESGKYDAGIVGLGSYPSPSSALVIVPPAQSGNVSALLTKS